jgi:hypothetical protein
MRDFVRDEVWPLEVIDTDLAGFTRLIRPCRRRSTRTGSGQRTCLRSTAARVTARSSWEALRPVRERLCLLGLPHGARLGRRH